MHYPVQKVKICIFGIPYSKYLKIYVSEEREEEQEQNIEANDFPTVSAFTFTSSQVQNLDLSSH